MSLQNVIMDVYDSSLTDCLNLTLVGGLVEDIL